MKTIWPKISLLLLCCAAIAFEVWHFRPAHSSARQLPTPAGHNSKPDFVLLPATEATRLARFFGGPKAKIGSWEPTVGDMTDIEANLPQISDLSRRDPDANRHIDNPAEYFRQYGAVVIDGRRVLGLNAFCSIEQAHASEWRNRLIVILDGGKCFWRALFDVTTQKFTTLSVNGVA